MLCRLNHELLPDPGSPIARTTVPLLGRAAVAAVTAGTFSAGTGAVGTASVAKAAEASAVATGATAAAGRERDPPRPPRVRRRRVGRGLAAAVFGALTGSASASFPGSGLEGDSGSGSCREGRCDSTTGVSTGAP